MPRHKAAPPAIPAITRDDMESALWRSVGHVARGGDQKEAVMHLLTVAEEWALSCGASTASLERRSPSLKLLPPHAPKTISPRDARKGMRTHMLGAADSVICGKVFGSDVGLTRDRSRVTCGNCLAAILRMDSEAERARKEAEKPRVLETELRMRADDGSFLLADADGYRTCKRCKKRMLLTEEFSIDPAARAGRKPRCRKCVKETRAASKAAL